MLGNTSPHIERRPEVEGVVTDRINVTLATARTDIERALTRSYASLGDMPAATGKPDSHEFALPTEAVAPAAGGAQLDAEQIRNTIEGIYERPA